MTIDKANEEQRDYTAPGTFGAHTILEGHARSAILEGDLIVLSSTKSVDGHLFGGYPILVLKLVNAQQFKTFTVLNLRVLDGDEIRNASVYDTDKVNVYREGEVLQLVGWESKQ